jgi:hypothetical protein
MMSVLPGEIRAAQTVRAAGFRPIIIYVPYNRKKSRVASIIGLPQYRVAQHISVPSPLLDGYDEPEILRSSSC